MMARPPRCLTRSRLHTCVLINQLATPGLGSLLAGRVIAGAGQLLLALAGFTLIIIWMVQFYYEMIQRQLGQAPSRPAPEWMWNWGLILFGASWLWALATSFGLLRQARAAPPDGPPGIPPRLPPPTSS
jgi:hypothetical protein